MYNGNESNPTEEVNKMENATEGEVTVCLCKGDEHYYEGIDNKEDLTPWGRDGLHFCAHGWHGNYGDDFWNADDFKVTDVVEAVADYYLLDAIVSGVVNVPPVVKSEDALTGTDTIKFFNGHKWRDCCDTQELDVSGATAQHAPGCDPKKRKLNLFTFNPGISKWEDWHTDKVLDMVKHRVNVPVTFATTRAYAHARHTAMVERTADVFRRYLHYAIAGELSHRYDIVGYSFKGDYPTARAAWFGLVMTIGGAQAAKYAAEIFRSSGWGSMYGGEPWANIADTLYYYETGEYPAWLFVDRCFTLQHNTSSVFNKAQFPVNKSGWDALHMTPVLNAHAESDWNTLGVCASDETLGLFKDMWDLNNDVIVKQGGEPVEQPEFQVPKKCNNSFCSIMVIGSEFCPSHQPKTYYCVECSVKLNDKEASHLTEYGNKCEAHAKINTCGNCKKSIIPFYYGDPNKPKSFCDACKKNGTTQGGTASDGIIEGGTSIGDYIKQEKKKPRPKAKPKLAPSSKKPAFAAGESPAAKLKAAMAANADKPFIGKVEDD